MKVDLIKTKQVCHQEASELRYFTRGPQSSGISPGGLRAQVFHQEASELRYFTRRPQSSGISPGGLRAQVCHQRASYPMSSLLKKAAPSSSSRTSATLFTWYLVVLAPTLSGVASMFILITSGASLLVMTRLSTASMGSLGSTSSLIPSLLIMARCLESRSL